jgi:hypothetical protein
MTASLRAGFLLMQMEMLMVSEELAQPDGVGGYECAYDLCLVHLPRASVAAEAHSGDLPDNASHVEAFLNDLLDDAE